MQRQGQKGSSHFGGMSGDAVFRQASTPPHLTAHGRATKARFVRRGWQELNPCRPSQMTGQMTGHRFRLSYLHYGEVMGRDQRLARSLGCGGEPIRQSQKDSSAVRKPDLQPKRMLRASLLGWICGSAESSAMRIFAGSFGLNNKGNTCSTLIRALHAFLCRPIRSCFSALTHIRHSSAQPSAATFGSFGHSCI